MILPMQLRGNAEYWGIVCPSFAPELAVMSRMLSAPEGVTEETRETQHEQTWRDWEEMIELCRLIVARPQLWDTQFCNSVDGVLPPLERLSLPGAAERVVWVGGDATPERIGVVDWTGKCGAVVDVRPFWEVLSAQARDSMTFGEREAMARIVGPTGAGDGSGGTPGEGSGPTGKEGGLEDEEVLLISLAELITFMALAATRAVAWKHKIVIYVGDNTNVVGWLTTRSSNNRYARFLLRVLVRLETHFGFQTLAVYIRTGNNEFADDLTRLPWDQAKALLVKRGIQEIDLLPAWKELSLIHI